MSPELRAGLASFSSRLSFAGASSNGSEYKTACHSEALEGRRLVHLKIEWVAKRTSAFASPRKTLLKNLSTNFDKKTLEEIFEDLDLAQNLRPHELDVDSYLKVFERLKEDNERQKRRESCN